jgi:copper resistance protein B
MRLILPLAIAYALSVPLPAHAQHQGHVMPPPAPAAPVAKKKPTPKAVAKPAAKPTVKAPAKPATKAPALKRATTKATTPPKSPARKTASPAATPAAVDHSTMDHSQMQGMDHSTMDHSQMQGMDHSKMDQPQKQEMDHSTMDHSQMQGMDHPTMDHAGPPQVTPVPAVTQADRDAAFPDVHAHHLHGTSVQSYWLLDRLEVSDADNGTALGWEAMAWVGGDIQRIWLRSEGEAVDGRIEHGDMEVLYGRSVRPWWDVLAGVRQDVGEGPSRTWAAFGVQGLSPYKFEVAATAYIGQGGRTALRAEAEYDTLLTNRLILQWRAEANAYGKADPLAGIGSGLSTVEFGARLRYEITRQFAPYFGVEHDRAFGNTADLRRNAGHGAGDTRVVAGVRVWF